MQHDSSYSRLVVGDLQMQTDETFRRSQVYLIGVPILRIFYPVWNFSVLLKEMAVQERC